MQRNRRQYLTLAVLIPALLVAVPTATAATAKPKPSRSTKQPAAHEAFYRCRDAKGRSYVGQSIPPECMNADVEVLDSTGRVVRMIPGPESVEEAAAEKAAADARVAAANRDRTLLATYLSVADIERLRDQRLELLVQQGRVTEQYVANLRERESRLALDVQRFRPYSDKPNAPTLPDHIAEDIVNTVNGLQVYQQELAKNMSEQERLRAEFASDITRFKELKGLK
jgi:hypothetical protein